MKDKLWIKYPSIPLFIFYETTRFCNLKCKFCQLSEHEKNNSKRYQESSKNIIKKISESGVFSIIFTGGEPTTLSGIEELISYAHELKLSCELITNGFKVSSNLMNILQKTRTNVVVSLHGSEPEIHDRLTGKDGSWNSTIINIREMISRNIRLNELNFTATKENYKNFYDFAKIFSELINPLKIYTNRFICYKGKNKRDLEMSTAQLNYLASEMDKANNEFVNTKCLFGEALPFCFLNKKYRYLTSLCPAGISSACIDWKGNVRICTASDIILGNIFNKSLEKIWNSEKIKNLRDMKWLPEKCGACKLKNECRGVCFLNNPNK